MTTANSPDVIIAFVSTTSGSNPYPLTISDSSGLTWNLRQKYAPVIAGSETVDEYYAITNSPLSADSITVTTTGSTYEGLTVFGVSGANTVSPFDSNGGLHTKNNNGGLPSLAPNVSVSTSNANDFIFGMATIGNCVTVNAGSGFTLIQNPPVAGSEYKVVSSTQSSLSVNMAIVSSTSYWAMVGDAIKQAPYASPKIKGSSSCGERVPSKQVASSLLYYLPASSSSTLFPSITILPPHPS